MAEQFPQINVPTPEESAQFLMLLLRNERSRFSMEDAFGSLGAQMSDGALEGRLADLLAIHQPWQEAGGKFLRPFQACIAEGIAAAGITDPQALDALSDTFLDALDHFEQATPEARHHVLRPQSGFGLREGFSNASDYLAQHARQVVLIGMAVSALTPHGGDKPLPHAAATHPGPRMVMETTRENPAIAIWKQAYERYYTAHISQKAYHAYETNWAPNTYRDVAADVDRVGYGTSLDSKDAAHLFHAWGVDIQGLKNGQAVLSQPQAERLLHARACQSAFGALEKAGQETGKELTTKYAERMKVLHKIHQGNPAIMKAIVRQATHPEEVAFDAARTKETNLIHTARHAKPDARHVSERVGFPHDKIAALAKKAKHGPQLKTNVNLGVRTDPRAYVSRALVDDFAKKFDALSSHTPGDTDHPFYQNMAELLAKLEGVVLTKYADSEGHITIGGGHLLKHKAHPNDPEPKRITDAVLGNGWYDRCMAGETISKQQAMALTKHHIVEKEKALMSEKRVGKKAWGALSEKQKAGLVSLAFNCGPGGLNQGICKPLREGDFKKAGGRITARINRLAAWRNRRQLEGEFVADQHLAYTVKDAMPVFKKEIKALTPRSTLAFEVPNTAYLAHLLDRVNLGEHTALAQISGTDSVIVAQKGEDAGDFERLTSAQAAQLYPGQFALADSAGRGR